MEKAIPAANDGLLICSRLKAGDLGPVTGKNINTIIIQENNFIVFIDEEFNIVWYTNDLYENWMDGFGSIVSKLTDLEILVDRHLKGKELYHYKCMIAEGYARALDDRNRAMAKKTLKRSKSKIVAFIAEKLRVAYLGGSFMGVVIVILLLLPVILYKQSIKSLNPEVYPLLVCSFLGGIGAFVSTFIRSLNYKANVEVASYIHLLDGLIRIFYGVIAGLIIFLGIKANVTLGFVNSNKNDYFLYFLSTIAGASEVLLPSIIKKQETIK